MTIMEAAAFGVPSIIAAGDHVGASVHVGGKASIEMEMDDTVEDDVSDEAVASVLEILKNTAELKKRGKEAQQRALAWDEDAYGKSLLQHMEEHNEATTNSEKGKEAKTKTRESKKRKRREVQVVSCPSGFPISTKQRTKPVEGPVGADGDRRGDGRFSAAKNNNKLLDWDDTAKEIRSFGATSFVGKQKREFKDEEYEKLTGRKLKKHHVPLPIRQGIKKKADQRLARQIQEAKESGTVLPKDMTKKKKKDKDQTARIHGPAPSVGFMSKGMLKVRKPS